MSFEPPLNPDDDTNPSRRIDLNDEPPLNPDDTSPSKSQLMQAVNVNDEPPIAPDDTSPSKSQLMQAVRLDDDPNAAIAAHPDDLHPAIPAWRHIVGLMLLFVAVVLTAGAVLVFLFAPQGEPQLIVITSEPESVAVEPTRQPDATPTPLPPTDVPAASTTTTAPEVLPTINPEQVAAILQQQPAASVDDRSGFEVVRNLYNPFTLIPDRPRGEVIQYAVERGDSIASIAEKFGLRQESIAWANDRNIIGILPVGRPINIVPVDGVLIPAHTGTSTIADYANRYGVDPYDIIESEYNPELRGLTPETIPPSGAQIMIPGGEAEQINWNPTVVREDSGGNGSGGGGVNYITFAPGDPGSCGRVANPGGGAFWSNPLANYTWIRGFTSFHTGVDLAVSEGTPVRAANSGRVIFAGWNNWGYGYAIVLAHGPFTTVYGHLRDIYVACGQDVSAGTVIGGSGNTGNSSGPHLHFEIRYNDQPQDPTISIGF